MSVEKTHKKLYNLNPDSREALPVCQYGKRRRSTVSKPNKPEEMPELCMQLSKEFQFVRIDCLEADDRIYINDMSADSDLFQLPEPVEWDKKLGDLFVIN